MTVRVGSLFAGYGGLDLAVSEVIADTSTAWYSEIEAGPCRILAERFPGVPNLGDITVADFDQVEPVDVLVGGFPCQDVSSAGVRRGFTPDSRSGLWSHFARAIEALNPRLVVIENVRGLLSASAAGAMEPDPWGVGDGAARPAVNAFGVVLGNLADLGYDARWTGVRAADAGAPHGRFRVFVIAAPRHPAGPRREGRPASGGGDDSGVPAASGVDAAADAERVDTERRRAARVVPGAAGEPGEQVRGTPRAGGAAADADDRRREQRDPGVGRLPLPDQGDAAAADTSGERRGEGRERAASVEGAEVPDERGSRAAAADADVARRRGERRHRPAEHDADRRDGAHGDGHPTRGVAGIPAWGPYAPAVARWERVTGRAAPAPTKPDGKAGQMRLSTDFVEWMMGLPAGWVTDVAGLSRSAQLKALGNGVVPQQAALALRLLLEEL